MSISEDRANAIRVTKPGEVIFAAYVISDGCLLDEGFKRGNINVAEYIEKRLLDSKTFAANLPYPVDAVICPVSVGNNCSGCVEKEDCSK